MYYVCSFLLFLRVYFNLVQQQQQKQISRKFIQFLNKVSLSQMNRWILSYRQAYVEFPVQAGAGSKSLYPKLICRSLI